MSKIKKVINNNFCLGCGLCESICPSYKMEMHSNGFYYPQIPVDRKKGKEAIMGRVCPSVNVSAPNGNDLIWGNVKATYLGWANDTNVRKNSSSGGIVASLAIYMLDSGIIDGFIHVKQDEENLLENKLTVSKTREDVIKASGSRYAPSLFLNNIIQLLEKDESKYAFAGKPCDIIAIKNLQKEYPQYRNRIVLFMAIFCGGVPSLNATKKLLCANDFHQLQSLRYRGDGWPGFFTAKFKDGNEVKKSYNESWGNVLGHYVMFRCKICPDTIGLSADLTIGDGWKTKDGYPDFAESDGRSFVLVRTNVGKEYLQAAFEQQIVKLEELPLNQIKSMQPSQYKLRFIKFYRLLPFFIAYPGFLNFKGLNLFKLGIRSNVKTSWREFKGTLKRFNKRNKY